MQLFFLHFILLVFGLYQKYIAGSEYQSYISVNHKQPCVQTVANHRLEETKKALIRNTEVQAKVIVSICVCVHVCACVFSFMNKSTKKKKVFVPINDSDVTVAFAVKR